MEIFHAGGKGGLVGTGFTPQTHTIGGNQAHSDGGYCLHISFLECFAVELQAINVRASTCMPRVLAQIDRLAIPLHKAYADRRAKDDLSVRDTVDVKLQ